VHNQSLTFAGFLETIISQCYFLSLSLDIPNVRRGKLLAVAFVSVYNRLLAITEPGGAVINAALCVLALCVDVHRL
jgi:hypothetical protein